MVGTAEMREVALWVQTDAEGYVQIAYWPQANPSDRRLTAIAETRADKAHAVTLIADQVEPGERYDYEVLLDGEKVLLPQTLSFETPPDYQGRTPPPDVTVAIASGHYANEQLYDPPFRTPGGDYEIFLSIATKDPAALFWVGNTAHLRPADWGSRSGYLSRFSHARAVPELRRLMGSVPQYATWGEADFAPNESAFYQNHVLAKESFQLFWPNTQRGIHGLEGVTSFARWSDVDFFLLDNQWNREDAELVPNRQTFGEAQLAWLLTALQRSTATFKVILSGGPILNPAKETPGNWSYSGSERDDFIDALTEAEVPGVVFISGGKNYTELTRLVRSSGYPLFDLTVAPVTARPAENTQELNFFRVPTTSVFERNFATLQASGPENARELTLAVYNAIGEEQWSKTLTAAELGYSD